MKRRTLLSIATAALAAPRIGNAAAAKPLRFVPDADLAMLDPVVTTSYQTRDHGFMVFDTLYGQDDQYRIRPQMVAGHTTEDDGKTWKLTLRDGLKFHDGEKGAGPRRRRLRQPLGQARLLRPGAWRARRRNLRPRRPDR